MSETNDYVPLWTLCSFDDDLLPDSTSPEYSFNYVDISNVETGRMEVPEQTFTFSEAPSRARRLAQPGDVAISTVRTYLRAIAPVPKTTQNLVLSTGFCIVRPLTSTTDGRFVNYLLTANQVVDEIVADSTGTSYPATSATKISRLRVPAPPLPTQRAIADYLDRETAEIDAMRADLDEMERLLEERRAAVVERLLLGKSTPALENLPSGWKKTTIGTLFSLHNGDRGINYPSPDEITETGIPFINAGDLASGRINLETCKRIKPEKYAVMGGAKLRKNDLLFCLRGSLGKWGLVDFDGGALASSLCALRLERVDLADVKYIAHAMATRVFSLQVWLSESGSAQPNLGAEQLSRFRIPLPPLADQRRIADEIDRETAEIDSMLEDITKLRDLLVERRSAVISAAVTGEIDIPVSLDDKDEPHA